MPRKRYKKEYEEEYREEGAPTIPPKRSLGQNFLTSTAAFAHILEAGKVKKGDVVLEIGPGKGALTEKLLAAGAMVVALEKDRRLIPLLEEKFAPFIEKGELILMEGDALLVYPESIPILADGYKIVANIPYYITGAFLRKYLSASRQPRSMTVLVQKEVAERILARDGKESLLSLSVKAYGSPRIAAKVSRGSFYPAPNVDSAILQIDDISRNFFDSTAEETFFKVLKAGFSQKRKILASNLKHIASEEAISRAFTSLSLAEKARAEDLSLGDWKKLSSILL